MAEPPTASTVAAVVREMRDRLADVPAAMDHHKHFLGTYLRTTEAVGLAVDAAAFEDPHWVSTWDVAFAELYLAALDAAEHGRPTAVPRPWRLAFDAPPELSPLRHVLLGINAHVNYDLPQALLAVISEADFDDAVLIERRRRDHARVDGVLSSRVAAEDQQVADKQTVADRLLGPLNRLASKRFLREAREKVWLNVEQLHRARAEGPDAFGARLKELEVLTAAKVAELRAPGQVLLRLAISGFGVLLPPAAEG